jgi:hypothetical protein
LFENMELYIQRKSEIFVIEEENGYGIEPFEEG